MYPRLRLSRNLLADDGVIFISIDDNEVDNLKKMCIEIFGQENFIGMLSVENNPKGRKNSDFISVSSEYCLIFAKQKKNAYFVENVPKKAKDMVLDENGRFVHGSGKRVLVGENGFNNVVSQIESDKNYSVYYKKQDKSIKFRREEYGIDDQQLIENGYEKYWSHSGGKLIENTYTKTKLKELFDEEALEFANGKIYEKNFSDTIRIKSQLVNREYEAIVRGEKKKFSMELTTTGAGTYIKELFGTGTPVFQAPKNTGFLKMLLTLIDGDDFITLDFFSGSASFADAVMQLNALDNGYRKNISVQFPEWCDKGSEAYKNGYKNICEIGKERIRRAGEKIKAEIEEDNSQVEIGKEPKQCPDIGFKVFKLDSSNIKEWQPDYDEFEKTLTDSLNNFVEGRTEEDVVYEIMLKMGLDLTYPVEETVVNEKKIYSIGFGALMICLDNDITSDVADEMVKQYKELQPETWKVVFKDIGFEDDSAKTNIKEILKIAGLEEDAFTTI